MNYFSVSHLGDEIIGTWDDGEHRLVLRQKPTDDFLFDCACILDSISLKLHLLEQNKNEKNKKEN